MKVKVLNLCGSRDLARQMDESIQYLYVNIEYFKILNLVIVINWNERQMRVLISGFEPFANNKINPTVFLVNSLCNLDFAFDVHGIVLPVSYSKSFQVLECEINKYSPDIVISFGLAEKRENINFEQFAINMMSSKVPDNEGVVYINKLIDLKGEDRLTTSLPVSQMQEVLENNNMSSELSNSAGTYVCNQVMYKTLQQSHNKGFKSGFIHVPSFDYLNKNELLKYGSKILNTVYELNR